jgi:hypothetical protein
VEPSLIELIYKRLRAWAEWSVARSDGGTPYARQFAYREREICGNVVGWLSPTDESSLECEQAVGWLLHCRRPLGDLICLTYRDKPSWSCQMRATLIGVSCRTVHRRIDDAHAWLSSYFEDRRRGIPAPQMDLIK